MPSKNTDFGITLKGLVDLSQAEKDITAFTSKNKDEHRKVVLPTEIETESATTKLKNAIEKGWIPEVEKGMKKINTIIKQGITWDESKKDFINVNKIVETFKNDLGKIEERVSYFTDSASKKLKPLQYSLNTIQEGVKSITTEVNTSTEKMGNFDAKVTKVTETITDTNNQIKQVITKTTEWVDAQGKLNQQIEKTDKDGNQLSSVMINISDDAKKATKLVNELNTAISNINKSDVKRTETKTFIDANGVKTVTEYVNGVRTLTTETRQYTNSLRELVTETKVYEGEEKKLVSVNEQKSRNVQQEIQQEREQLNARFNLREETIRLREEEERLLAERERLNNALVSTTTTQTSGYTTQFGDESGRQYKALVTSIESINAANERVIRTTYEFTNAQGQLVRQTRTTDAAGNKLAEDTIELSNANNRASSTNTKLAQSSNEVAQAQNNMGNALKRALTTLTQYYLASLPIRAVREGIQETITTVKEFDSALIEFRKVSDLAGESLTDYVAKLAEMGEVTGSTMQAMVEASTQFRKSGYSDEDSAKLASIAEKYRNIADEEIDAGEAASFIIAQMKAFNIEAGQAEHIIDAVNEVANNFSVSSADLARNLGNMSEIMAINNVSMEQQIGMLTGVTEITRNASSASRGLVMISSRLTQVLDDSSSTGKKLTKIYSDLGIELLNEEGQLRSHYDILGDLAKKWDSLSENQQKYIALTSAGARQQQNFVALMANWNQVAKATNTAYESMGSAQRENEKVMDSIAKKVEILRSEFQQLVIGKGGLQEVAKNLLDVGIALLKFANSDVGKVVIKMTALVVSFTLLRNAVTLITSKAIPNLAKSLLDLGNMLLATSTTNNQVALSLMGVASAETATEVATVSLSEAFSTLFAGLMANPIGLIVAGATILIATFVKLKQKIDETNERIEEAKNTIADLTQEINLLHYAEQKEAGLSKAEKDRLAYLEKRLELEKKIKEQAETAKTGRVVNALTGNFMTAAWGSDEQNQMAGYAGIGVQAAFDAVTGKKPQTQWSDADEATLTKYQKLNEEIKTWNDYTEEGTKLLEQKYNESQTYLNALEAERDDLGKQREEYQKNAERYDLLKNKKELGIELSKEEREELKNLEGTQRELNDRDKERLDVLEANIGEYQKSVDEIRSYQQAIEEFGEESEEADNYLQELAKELQISEEELVANANSLGVSIDAYYDYAKAVKNSDSAIDAFQSSLGTLQNAVEEYNENQYLSIDTIQALLKLEPEYLGMLVEENGQLSLNEEAIMDKVNSLIEERKQIALEMAYERLQAIERGNNQAAAESEAGAIDGNTSSLNAETTALSKNTIEQYANRIARNDKSKGTAASEVVRELEKELSVLDKIGDSYKKISGSAKKAGSAGKSGANKAKDAQKELNKELEETKKKYETVIKWISKQYDKEIDKIKKAKDEAVDAEEAKIKAKEEEKDTALDAIEAEIRALEREKNELKAQKEVLDDRKNALKDEEDTIVKGIEKRIKALEKERDALIKPIEERIKALEKERDTIIDSMETEIDALTELKEQRQTYWDEQINALKEANKELKDNLELQEKLDALEKAKATKVKVYKEGQGFVYDVDQNAVQQAQKALDEYLSQKAYEDELARLEALKDAEIKSYDDRLNELKKYKDDTKKVYDQQIEDLKNYKDNLKENYTEQIDSLKEYKEQVQEQYEEQIELLNQDIDALERHMDELDKHKDALEEHKDAVEEQYEAEIAALEAHKDEVERAYDAEIQTWERYKQEFEDMVNAYEEQQNRLLFEQLTGIKDESNNWMTRLDNLAEFVRKYNELQKQLDTGNTDVSNNASMREGSIPTSSSYSSGYSSGNNRTVTNYNTSSARLGTNSQYTPSYSSSGSKYGSQPTFSSKALEAARNRVSKHAKGISSIANNEVALVGDSPNQELVIGSKLNGSLMSLDKGAGVVNANSATTLAGMLNQVGKYGASGFGSGGGTLNNNYNNDTLTINGVTIQGANISSPETFVNGLLNLKAEALQRAYRHR